MLILTRLDRFSRRENEMEYPIPSHQCSWQYLHQSSWGKDREDQSWVQEQIGLRLHHQSPSGGYIKQLVSFCTSIFRVRELNVHDLHLIGIEFWSYSIRKELAAIVEHAHKKTILTHGGVCEGCRSSLVKLVDATEQRTRRGGSTLEKSALSWYNFVSEMGWVGQKPLSHVILPALKHILYLSKVKSKAANSGSQPISYEVSIRCYSIHPNYVVQ